MTVYNGNTVGYVAGSNPDWYVRVTVTDGGSNTGTTTTVHYLYEIVFAGPLSDNHVSVTWSDPWGGGTIDYAVNLGGAGSVVPVGAAAGNDRAATIQYGGGNSLHFSLSVTGVGSSNTGPSSVAFDYPLPPRTPSEPSAPTGYSARNITSSDAYTTGVAVADDGGSAINDLRAEYNTSQSDSGAAFADPGVATDPHMTGLAPATTYYFRVAAHNAIGWSAWGAWVSFVTLATVPSAPTGLASSNLLPTTATVSWAAPANGGSGITSYDVQIATDAGFTVGVQTLNGGASPRNLTGLMPATPYYFRARANNAVGNGAWSASATFTTLPALYLGVGGVVKSAIPYVGVGGVPKMAIPYIGVGGIPKL